MEKRIFIPSQAYIKIWKLKGFRLFSKQWFVAERNLKAGMINDGVDTTVLDDISGSGVFKELDFTFP